jgi:predicted Holliday junction resolvase-like endonuclease
MHDSDFWLLIGAALVVIVVLFLMWYRARSEYQALRVDINERVQQQFALWRDRELESERANLSQTADAQAKVNLKAWKIETEEKIRKDAVRRASSVLSGKVTEHLAPYLPDFPYDPRDVRFLGTPVDLIVFDGMSDDDDVREVVFVEVKTGSSSLTTRERRVRDAVQEKRVSWKIFHLETGHDSPGDLPGDHTGPHATGSGGLPWWKQKKGLLP